MNLRDEAQRLRIRGTALADELKGCEFEPACGTPSLLAQTKVVTAYPTTPQCYFACQPLALLGQEVEGAPGAVSPSPVTFFALNLGTSVPPIGTQVVVTFVGNRWVFRYDA